VMEQDQATLLVALVTCSMALTPPLVMLGARVLQRALPGSREETFEDARGSVLLLGFGRFGQVVSQLLLPDGIDITAIDNDIEMIEAAERFGFRVYYGDGTRLDVLRAAGIGRARLICICVEKQETANRIVDLVKEGFPDVKLYVRAFDRTHALELLQKGVDFQMRETYESAITFGRGVLTALGLESERVAELEADVRRRDQERLELQQREGLMAGGDRLYTRPAPKPEPLTTPRRKPTSLNASETSEATAESRTT